jgi:outer membrane lipoprotein-sorting protein
MEYPKEVLTKNKKGEYEVRLLVSKGKYVKYQYMDPKTGKIVENGKFSIIMKSESGEEHLYLIPMKGRFLAIPVKDEKKHRKVWDGEKAVELW